MRGLQNLVKYRVHSITVVGRRLVEHVAPEVRLASLPDEAWEGFSERLDKAFVYVAGRDLNAGESSAIGLPSEEKKRW